jgi:hypothetical protein
MTDEELRQMNIERLRNYGSALYNVIIERYKVLPTISTISSALAVFIFQGTTLIQTRILAHISLVILLILIPLSIFGTLYQLGKDADHVAENIKNLLHNSASDIKNVDFFNPFLWILFFFFSMAIILMILSFFNLQ